MQIILVVNQPSKAKEFSFQDIKFREGVYRLSPTVDNNTRFITLGDGHVLVARSNNVGIAYESTWGEYNFVEVKENIQLTFNPA